MISQKFQTGERSVCVTPASRLKPAMFALNSRVFDARSRLKSLSRGLGAAAFLLGACCSSHAELRDRFIAGCDGRLDIGWGDRASLAVAQCGQPEMSTQAP